MLKFLDTVLIIVMILIVAFMFARANDIVTKKCEQATIKATEIHWRYVMGKDTNLTNSFNIANIMKKECAS